ncbi:MAG: Uncharacterised protein [SAR116 cluster bacterium MED-G04]|jgi:hypothetical protein|nr:MAG: Uncharacterised protein [SAR116 cluster bacterium MED-G04]
MKSSASTSAPNCCLNDPAAVFGPALLIAFPLALAGHGPYFLAKRPQPRLKEEHDRTGPV